MATIGRFRVKDDGYEGTISTLGMAKARGDEERPYLEVFLDDLGSSASVWTALLDMNGKSDLVCPRSKVNRS